MANVNLTIDGKPVSVPPGTTILHAARQLGIDIPTLCHSDALPVFSGCRMCIVEIAGRRKLETSCSTLVREGMEVRTETERVVRYRRAILQLLLDSHPNDCLTCDKAGDCGLQKYAWRYKVTFREHDGARRPKNLDLSSPYIAKDNSKCILCGKCVRVCDQVKEERQVLAFAGRGYEAYIAADDGRSLADSKCVSCNRCVSVCPVGALMDRRSAQKGRPWEFQHETKQCRVCEYGCRFDVLKKDGEAVAVKALPPGEGRPLCLKGRLTTELLNVKHPDAPFRKLGNRFQETTWAKALGMQRLLARLEEADGEKD